MIIPDSKQIKELDRLTVQQEGISSFQLMHRAAYQCTKFLLKHFHGPHSFHVLCGPGNNGGDGFLIAAFLFQRGYDVRIFELGDSSTTDRQLAKDYALKQGITIESVESFVWDDETIVIDALLGIGLNKPLEGIFLQIVQQLNASSNLKISIDIPTGMPGTRQQTYFKDFVHADYVLTFQFPKVSFFQREYREQLGQILTLDIGINPPEGKFFTYQTIEERLIRQFYQRKGDFSHKNLHGSVLLIGGASEFPGAIVLATKGALLSGVGKTFVQCSEQALKAGLTQCPEAIFSNTMYDESLSNSIQIQKVNAIVLGPGLTTKPQLQEVLEQILLTQTNWVLDADALNWLASGQINLPSGQVILTPHHGEFDRLTQPHLTDEQRWKSAEEYARINQVLLVLKGPYTTIFTPNGTKYISTISNAGLAKGGSGDLLSGMIGGYLARGYSMEEAALIGVYLHSKAAEWAVESVSMDALTASLVASTAERIAKRWEN